MYIDIAKMITPIPSVHTNDYLRCSLLTKKRAFSIGLLASAVALPYQLCFDPEDVSAKNFNIYMYNHPIITLPFSDAYHTKRIVVRFALYLHQSSVAFATYM